VKSVSGLEEIGLTKDPKNLSNSSVGEKMSVEDQIKMKFCIILKDTEGVKSLSEIVINKMQALEAKLERIKNK